MNVQRVMIFLVAALAFSLAGVWVFNHSHSLHATHLKQIASNSRPLSQPVHIPDLIIHGLTLKQYNAQGQRIKTVHSQQVKHYPPQEVFYFKNTLVKITTKNQEHYELQARHTTANKKFDRFIFHDQVKLSKQAPTPESSFQLTTERLVYSNKNETAYTHSPLTMVQAGHTVHAEGMTARLKSNHLTLNHPKAEIHSDHVS